MRNIRKNPIWLGIAALAFATALGAPAAVDAGEEAIVVIVNSKSGIDAVTTDELRNIYLGKRKNWSDGARVVPINLSPSHFARVKFDQLVLDKSPEEVGRYWVEQKIKGQARPPKSVPSPALVVKLVAKLPGAVGYVPLSAANSTVTIATVNGVTPKAGDYPLAGK